MTMPIRPAAGALLSLALGFVSLRAEAVAVGDGLEGVSLQRHGGGTLDAAALRGKVTVMNFWATWCAACKVELVEMEEQFARLRQEKDVQFAFVSLDKDAKEAEAWFKGNLKDASAMLKDLFVDSQFQVADKLAVDAFPLTIIVGKDGKVLHVQRGFKEGEGSTQELAHIVTEQLR